METRVDENTPGAPAPAAEDTAIARDLRLNLQRLLGSTALGPDLAALALLALARSTGSAALERRAREALAGPAGVALSETELREAEQAPAMMGMLNVYYRFRHLLAEAAGKEAAAPYGTAGLRMNALARPALGKKRWEMLAFSLSVLNGCASCIASHEKTLRDEGLATEAIHDLARLAAVVSGVARLEGQGVS